MIIHSQKGTVKKSRKSKAVSKTDSALASKRVSLLQVIAARRDKLLGSIVQPTVIVNPKADPRSVPTLSRSKPLFPLTDIGNAQRLVAYFGNALRYVSEWDSYLVWNGRFWQRDTGSVRTLGRAIEVARAMRVEASQASVPGLRDEISMWSLKSDQATRVHAMVDLARGLPEVLLDHTSLDCDPWSLQCENGVLDLRQGTLVKVDPSRYITRSTGVIYDASATCPTWDRFLERVLPDSPTRVFMQRLAGYCLTGNVSERILVILHGYGRNGKSVFLRVLQSILGGYAGTAAPSLLMAKAYESHPAETAALYGLRLAVTSEIKKGRVFDEEAVKRLTGNDVLACRGMRENWWNFTPTHKLIVATNPKPRVRDSSDSIWDRILMVPFTQRIQDSEVDRKLVDKLIAEAPGVLAWAVRGCALWVDSGLRVPEAVRAATHEYRQEEDIVGRFLLECCDLQANGMTPTHTLTQLSNRWTEANGLFRISEKALAERLLEMGCVPKRSATVRQWLGVKPKEGARVELSDIGKTVMSTSTPVKTPIKRLEN